MKGKGYLNEKRFFLITLLASTAFLFGACASRAGYESVPAAAAGTSQSIKSGTVLDVRLVTIEGQKTGIGYTTGAILGSAVGQTIGSGSGRILAAAGGAAVGGIVGDQAEKDLTSKTGQEITIDLDEGPTIAIVQENKQPEFNIGDRVTVLETRAGFSRVKHDSFGIDPNYN